MTFNHCDVANVSFHQRCSSLMYAAESQYLTTGLVLTSTPATSSRQDKTKLLHVKHSGQD